MCASGAVAPRFELLRTSRVLARPRRALPRERRNSLAPAAHSPCTRTNGENTTRQPVYPGADPHLRHFSARSRVTVLRATHPRNLNPCDNNTPRTTPRAPPRCQNCHQNGAIRADLTRFSGVLVTVLTRFASDGGRAVQQVGLEGCGERVLVETVVCTA